MPGLYRTVTFIKTDEDIADAISKKHLNGLDHSNVNDHAPHSDDQDISGKVDKVTGSSLVADIEITKIHASGSDNQDLSNLVVKETGKSLVADSEIAKIHTNTLDHSHSNKTQIDLVTIGNHDVSTHAPSNAQKNSDITKAEIEAKLTGVIASHSHSGGGGESEIILKTTGDVTNSTTTFANVTGLTFPMAINTDYVFEVWLIFQSNTATTGIKFAVNGATSPVAVAIQNHIPVSLVAMTHGAARAYDSGTASASVDIINSNLLGHVTGIVRNGANTGTFAIRFAAETTGTVKIMTGSVLRYRQV